MSNMTGNEVDPDLQDGTASGADELPAGTELLQGQYKIESFLNAGGFGITYRAVDSLERPVVIKECFPGAFCRRSRTIVQARSRAHTSEFQSIVRLFVQEARSLSKLVHPNIVGVHQVFSENDTAYMALDFVEGRDLLEILEDPDTDLSPEQITRILRHILGAVGFVHEQGMLHRDISPDNILLKEDGTPVLIDFGAARQQMQKQSRVLSALRVVKDGYSPQEFYVTGAEQGPFSDLYALGATFYHMIAGEAPPDSQSRLSAIATGDADPYRPLYGNAMGYPAPVLGAIDTALSVLPKDRWQNAADWLAAMEKTGRVASRLVTGRVKSRVKSRVADAPAGVVAAEAQSGGSKMPLLAGVAVLALAAAGGAAIFLQGDASALSELITAEDAAQDASQTTVDTPTETAFSSTTSGTASVTPTPPAEPQTNQVAVQTPSTPASDANKTPAETPAETAQTAAEAEAARRAEAEAEAQRIAAEAAAVARATFLESLPDTLRQADPADPRDQATEDALTLDSRQAEARARDRAELARVRPVSRPVGQPQSTPNPTLAPSTASVAKILGTSPATARSRSSAGLAPEIAEAGHSVTLAMALPGWDTLTPIPALAVTGAPIEPGPVTGTWSVALPLGDLRADPEGSLVIRSVNGVVVNDMAALERLLGTLGLDGAADEVSLQVGLGRPGQAAGLEQTLTVPVIHWTRLWNGLELRSERDGNQWVTIVTSLPTEGSTDLRVGDVLVADMNGGKRLQAAEDAQTLFETANANGVSTISFAVGRDGGNEIATLTLPPQS